jgi:hypothetical protein
VAVGKQTAGGSKEMHRVVIPNGVAVLENLEVEVDINGATETICENINISAKKKNA